MFVFELTHHSSSIFRHFISEAPILTTTIAHCQLAERHDLKSGQFAASVGLYLCIQVYHGDFRAQTEPKKGIPEPANNPVLQGAANQFEYALCTRSTLNQASACDLQVLA